MNRDRNRYAQNCIGCGQWVEAGAGYLYRYSGANLKRGMKKSASGFSYQVRCEACAVAHDKPQAPADPVESTGAYSGYGFNTHAPCGN